MGGFKITCGAIKGDGNPCGLPPGYRTSHLGVGKCYHHGGSTESGKKGAAKEMAKRERSSFAEVIVDTDPIQALLQEVSRTAGHVSWLAERLGVWSMDTNEEIPANQDQWLKVYQYERMHLARTAKIAIDAGVAQKQVALAEQQGQMLANAVNAILEGLNLSPEQKIMVPTLVPQVLRAIAVRTDQPQEAP
jgi:hypothetical protein